MDRNFDWKDLTITPQPITMHLNGRVLFDGEARIVDFTRAHREWRAAKKIRREIARLRARLADERRPPEPRE